ncbi:hypothetical protein QE152_g29082 [Popillia japonica]|uniref:Uncharacterized protein n=1 Tax=Popillia japonica TaxID=7064 RepID=A0AAW1JIQ2_POPJA
MQPEEQANYTFVANPYSRRVFSDQHEKLLSEYLQTWEQANYTFVANPYSRRVFSDQHEKLLSEYLQTCSKMHYGLTTKETRKFAYDYAVKCEVKYPKKWDESKAAKRDWLICFMNRHSELSIRQPEATRNGTNRRLRNVIG